MKAFLGWNGPITLLKNKLSLNIFPINQIIENFFQQFFSDQYIDKLLLYMAQDHKIEVILSFLKKLK